MVYFSSFCTLSSSSLSPEVKAHFIFSRPFRSGVIQGLFLGKHHMPLDSRYFLLRYFRYPVMQSLTLLMSSPCGLQRASQSGMSKQSLSFSFASSVHTFNCFPLRRLFPHALVCTEAADGKVVIGPRGWGARLLRGGGEASFIVPCVSVSVLCEAG